MRKAIVEALAADAARRACERRKVAFIQRQFPDTIIRSDGTPWVVDGLHATEEGETRSGRFYYENADCPPDRFYFRTYTEAALDLFEEIAFPEERAKVEEGCDEPTA